MPEFKSYLDFLKFEYETKKRTRYVYAPEIKAFLDTVLQTSAKRVVVLKQGHVLWRAQSGCEWKRITDEKGEHIDDRPKPYPPERMKPLNGQAKEGRANPKGISYLYLTTKRKTALAEVCIGRDTFISVGKFKTSQDLRLVNCITGRNGLMLYLKEPSAKKREESVWAYIDRAFATPVLRNDDIADYVPTQIIAELFKANNFDGIVYRSSLGKGHNIALFGLDMADLVKPFLFKTNSIKYDFQECSE